MTNEELIVSFEREFFTGSYSESTIKTDLAYRSTLGAGKLEEKRKIYFQDFDLVLTHIDRILREDTALISRCERCKNQVNRLSDIVRGF